MRQHINEQHAGEEWKEGLVSRRKSNGGEGGNDDEEKSAETVAHDVNAEDAVE